MLFRSHVSLLVWSLTWHPCLRSGTIEDEAPSTQDHPMVKLNWCLNNLQHQTQHRSTQEVQLLLRRMGEGLLKTKPSPALRLERTNAGAAQVNEILFQKLDRLSEAEEVDESISVWVHAFTNHQGSLRKSRPSRMRRSSSKYDGGM